MSFLGTGGPPHPTHCLRCVETLTGRLGGLIEAHSALGSTSQYLSSVLAMDGGATLSSVRVSPKPPPICSTVDGEGGGASERRCLLHGHGSSGQNEWAAADRVGLIGRYNRAHAAASSLYIGLPYMEGRTNGVFAYAYLVPSVPGRPHPADPRAVARTLAAASVHWTESVVHWPVSLPSRE